ncbi:hypothetical protein BC828DRAFT_372599 [Blastocladiella britannica]|nr:hypothetical protein BC828DRAFT_372599 [Blastocladiella britannica]
MRHVRTVNVAVQHWAPVFPRLVHQRRLEHGHGVVAVGVLVVTRTGRRQWRWGREMGRRLSRGGGSGDHGSEIREREGLSGVGRGSRLLLLVLLGLVGVIARSVAERACIRVVVVAQDVGQIRLKHFVATKTVSIRPAPRVFLRHRRRSNRGSLMPLIVVILEPLLVVRTHIHQLLPRRRKRVHGHAPTDLGPQRGTKQVAAQREPRVRRVPSAAGRALERARKRNHRDSTALPQLH